MEIDIRQVVRAVRRWWRVPIVAGLVLGLLGFGTASFTTTSYTANTQMLVTEQISGDAVLSSDARTETYLALVTSGPVLDRVILELGLEYTREDLVEDVIDVRIMNGTQIIQISVTSDDPDLSADIANSLTRNFIVTASDLSIGEVQRNLDDLRRQAGTIRDRIIVIDARLAEIDTETNADDSQIQAEISQLERDRLDAGQTLADLDQTIRELTTNLNLMSIPVVITDFAQAPQEGDGAVSPVLMAFLGVFMGGLLGIAWILFDAFTDRTLRTLDQIVSLPLMARIRRTDFTDEAPPAIAVLGARISGAIEAPDASSFVMVSARDVGPATELQSALAKVDPAFFGDVKPAESVFTDASAMRTVSAASEAVIVAILNQTSLNDLQEIVEILGATKTRIIGTVVVV